MQVELLCSGAGTWHTHRPAVSLLIFTEQESKAIVQEAHSIVTVVCNTQRGGHRTVALVGLQRSLQEMARAKGQPGLPPPCSPTYLLL